MAGRDDSIQLSVTQDGDGSLRLKVQMPADKPMIARDLDGAELARGTAVSFPIEVGTVVVLSSQ